MRRLLLLLPLPLLFLFVWLSWVLPLGRSQPDTPLPLSPPPADRMDPVRAPTRRTELEEETPRNTIEPPPFLAGHQRSPAPGDDEPSIDADRRLVLRGRAPTQPAPPPPFEDGSGKEAIRTALREIAPGLRDCYEQGRSMHPTLAGRLVLDLTIEGRDGVGRILEASIDDESSTLGAVLVQACILDQLSDATFPVPRDHGVIAFRYPFTFLPP